MTQVHKHRRKASPEARSGDTARATRPPKAHRSKLQQVGFEEGSALLKPPVEARSQPKAPKLPPLPQVPQVPQNRALAEEPQAQQQAEADNPVAVRNEPEPQQAMAQPDQVAARDPEPALPASSWCVLGLDDPDAAEYCDKRKQAAPDKAASFVAEATSHLDTLKSKPDVYDKLKKSMSDEDMIMVALYSGQASYAMNAVLRGQLKSAPWIFAYAHLAHKAAKALTKVPKGAKNKLETVGNAAHLDPSKAGDKIVPIGTVYRADAWSGFFDPVFAAEYQVGRSLEEPGFLSTTLAEGSYDTGAPVRKTIEGAKVSRSISDLSMVGTENEALFPPGQRFQITAIEHEDTDTKIRTPCSKPGVAYPAADKGPQAFNNDKHVWHVKLKHVTVAKGKKSAGPEKKKDKASRADKPAQGSTFLERLLGVANTMD